ncbi:MAG: ankyrin repeat domain-containing protein [Alphaproteobacteria bacterium]
MSLEQKLFDGIKDGNERVAGEALSDGANPNAFDEEGRTPLMRAIAKDMKSLMHRIYERGADPNLASPDGFTPMHAAATCTVPGIIQLLVMRDTRVVIRDKEGRTPLDLAQDGPNPEVCALIAKYGKDESDWIGRTATQLQADTRLMKPLRFKPAALGR